MNLYHDYTFDELRNICRTNIEAFETWARRLIHAKLTEKYGQDYINVQKSNGEFFIKKDLREHVSTMLSTQPDRFPRPVDTLFTDDIIYILCHPSFYRELFKEALDYSYPQGVEEVREFLGRLIPIRNPLSHTNPISMRQAEQAICYTHDFIDSLKQYYKDIGEEQMWNVPRIISVSDSFGNRFDNFVDKNIDGTIFDINKAFHCGEQYSVEVEVDPSFDPNSYTIIWEFNKHDFNEFNNQTNITITFGMQDISTSSYLRCKIISNKEWHKYKYFDCKVSLCLTILPPID